MRGGERGLNRAHCDAVKRQDIPTSVLRPSTRRIARSFSVSESAWVEYTFQIPGPGVRS
jgi:hypothetical protein